MLGVWMVQARIPLGMRGAIPRTPLGARRALKIQSSLKMTEVATRSSASSGRVMAPAGTRPLGYSFVLRDWAVMATLRGMSAAATTTVTVSAFGAAGAGGRSELMPTAAD